MEKFIEKAHGGCGRDMGKLIEKHIESTWKNTWREHRKADGNRDG